MQSGNQGITSFKLKAPALCALEPSTGLAYSLRGDAPRLTHPNLGSFYAPTPCGRVELHADLARHFPAGAPVEIVRRDA